MQSYTLKDLTKILSQKESDIGLSKQPLFLRKFAAGFLFLLSDWLMIVFSLAIPLILRAYLFETDLQLGLYFKVLVFSSALTLFTFYLRGLYPGYGINVVQELKNIFYTITFVFGFLALLTIFSNDLTAYSGLIFILSWALAFCLIPIGRSIIRKLFSRKSWWGIPVVIIGAGNAGEAVINSLNKNTQIGFRPVVAVDDNVDRWGYISEIPVIGGLDIIPNLKERLNIDYAIMAMPKVPSKRQSEIISKYSSYFDNIVVIPDLFGLSSLWVTTKEFGGFLGLEVKQELIKPMAAFQKRAFDLILASILTILTIPLNLIIAAFVKLDSRGKVLFHQVRMGLNDSRFRIVKFRTMHTDAEERLNDLLNSNPELKREYEIYHKLNDDPRLTKVGKILRKFSLDELPQFWNVLKGEMSLIGPRAYMPWEKIKMSGNEKMILKVKPGISGLWQVTDRNESTFHERNMTDVYYIRNWSIFLDLYILARTILVVISGKGG